jgi:hypothetical protein
VECTTLRSLLPFRNIFHAASAIAFAHRHFCGQLKGGEVAAILGQWRAVRAFDSLYKAVSSSQTEISPGVLLPRARGGAITLIHDNCADRGGLDRILHNANVAVGHRGCTAHRDAAKLARSYKRWLDARQKQPGIRRNQTDRAARKRGEGTRHLKVAFAAHVHRRAGQAWVFLNTTGESDGLPWCDPSDAHQGEQDGNSRPLRLLAGFQGNTSRKKTLPLVAFMGMGS